MQAGRRTFPLDGKGDPHGTFHGEAEGCACSGLCALASGETGSGLCPLALSARPAATEFRLGAELATQAPSGRARAVPWRAIYWPNSLRRSKRARGEIQLASVEAVRSHASNAAFGQPLVQNNLRAIVVEAMVDIALPDGWRWSSADWAGWDFEHLDGTRLEVKQSAARQTWAAPQVAGQRRFDIALRRGRWEGAAWLDEPGRHAHLYLFADHPVGDANADHRNPEQWRFYPIPASDLPETKTLSLTRVMRLAEPCPYDELASRIELLRLNRR